MALTLKMTQYFHTESFKIKDQVVEKLKEKAKRSDVDSLLVIITAINLAQEGVSNLEQELTSTFSGPEYSDLRALFINSITQSFFDPDPIRGEIETALRHPTQ